MKESAQNNLNIRKYFFTLPEQHVAVVIGEAPLASTRMGIAREESIQDGKYRENGPLCTRLGTNARSLASTVTDVSLSSPTVCCSSSRSVVQWCALVYVAPALYTLFYVLHHFCGVLLYSLILSLSLSLSLCRCM